MRQMCNLAYASLTSQMSPKELERFNADLDRRPGASPSSSGVRDLMAVMAQFGGQSA